MSVYKSEPFQGAMKVLWSSPRDVEIGVHESFGPKGPKRSPAWWMRIGKWLAFEEMRFRASGASSLEESLLPVPRSARVRVSQNHMAAMIYGPLALFSCMQWPNIVSVAILLAATFSIPLRAHRWFREDDVSNPSLMWWDMLRLFWPVTIVFCFVEEVAYRWWEHDERRWATQADLRDRTLDVYRHALNEYRWCLRCGSDAQLNRFGHLKRALDTSRYENKALIDLVPDIEPILDPYKKWVSEYETILNGVLKDAEHRMRALDALVYENFELYEREGEELGLPSRIGELKNRSLELEEIFKRLEIPGLAYWLPGLPPRPRFDRVLESLEKKRDTFSN